MSTKKSVFGTLKDGREVCAYTLSNQSGAYVKIMDLGGTILQLAMPDRNGVLSDIVCGYDSPQTYLEAGGYQGALIGRFGNRIHDGRFILHGKEYILAKNENGITHLHGGNSGFNQKIWQAELQEENDIPSLILSCVSPDGEEGYPGTLKVTVTYTLTNENALCIRYQAVTDKDTILNLTNHTYFNLGGYDSGDILHQQIQINSRQITEVDAHCIPTGRLLSVEGTPFDLTSLTVIGDGIDAENEQICFGGGYDHNFVLENHGKTEKAAEVFDPVSGRVMEVFTNQPALQFYAANMMNDPHPFKGGVPQKPRHALCLETQHYPDSPNHSNFPSCELKPGEVYDYTTIYQFSVR